MDINSSARGPLCQLSPTSLAPGTGFMEDNFSSDLGVGEGVCNLHPSHEQFIVESVLL